MLFENKIPGTCKEKAKKKYDHFVETREVEMTSGLSVSSKVTL